MSNNINTISHVRSPVPPPGNAGKASGGAGGGGYLRFCSKSICRTKNSIARS